MGMAGVRRSLKRESNAEFAPIYQPNANPLGLSRISHSAS
jgi:hypothetical protein